MGKEWTPGFFDCPHLNLNGDRHSCTHKENKKYYDKEDFYGFGCFYKCPIKREIKGPIGKKYINKNHPNNKEQQDGLKQG